MLHKFIFLLMGCCVLSQSCNSPANQTSNTEGDRGLKMDSVSIQNAVHQEGNGRDLPFVACADVLENKDSKHISYIFSDTLTVFNTQLFFVTRDLTLSVYTQKDKNCTFLLKIPIDSTVLNPYTEGCPLFLKDMDGDHQKEVLVTVEKNGGHAHFRVYRLVQENGQIVLRKIRRFEELINPEYDTATGMVRAHWYDRDDYELDDYFKISNDNTLVFVKGMERRNGNPKTYTTKYGW